MTTRPAAPKPTAAAIRKHFGYDPKKECDEMDFSSHAWTPVDADYAQPTDGDGTPIANCEYLTVRCDRCGAVMQIARTIE